MPQTPDIADPEAWHRYFAIECNNRAWDLAVTQRTPQEDREMLNTAHASAHHWSIVGDELNHMRAAMLLAEVHSLLGFGDSATDYAEEMRSFFLTHDSPDWEIAFVHTIHAHAASVAGHSDRHRNSYLAAVQAIEAIADEADRKIVLATFDQVAQP